MYNELDLFFTSPEEYGSFKHNLYRLLTKCEVKKAGYWPSSFFLRVYGPRRSRGL